MFNKVDLVVVMPVYNEEASIEKVVREWAGVLEKLKLDFEIHVYNDGSQDGTAAILNRLDKDPKIIVHHKKNSGHGSTILMGYLENQHAQWIFQVDSDDEINAEYFARFWQCRNDYDLVIGKRQNRNLGFIRKLISTIAYLAIFVNYGKCVSDVNCPYRLMKSSSFRDCFRSIPEHTFAPNVIITGYAAIKKLACHQIEVPYTFRSTGAVSIAGFRLLKSALRSFIQTFTYRWMRFSS
jgi:glycosyltransferase involved in cell wall biosynthesis